MELKDLLDAARATLDDTVEPTLWSDEELTRWLNNAVREVCIRARLLKINAVTDPARCVINVSANQELVTPDPTILMVQSGTSEDSRHKLWAVTSGSMDLLEPGWDNGNATPAPVRYLIMDAGQKQIQLWPTPSDPFVLRIRAWRTPSEDEQMESPSDEPVVAIPDPEDLKHWACYEAYLKQGAETYDTGKAQTQLGIFESRFGSRPDFHEMARWADSPPRVRHGNFF